jgi:hypothetical protein
MAACCACSPDQHVARRAEFLQLHVAEAQPAQRRPHLGEIRWAGLRLHLDQRATNEIDAEVQSVKEEQQDRDNRQCCRCREANAPKAHEVELGVIRDDPQQRDGTIEAHVRFRL